MPKKKKASGEKRLELVKIDAHEYYFLEPLSYNSQLHSDK